MMQTREAMAYDGPVRVAFTGGRAGAAGGLLEVMQRSLRLARAVVGNDQRFMRAATALAFVGKPRARRSWDWYRSGTARPMRVETAALWHGDRGFAACCGRAIAEALDDGQSSGRVWIDQRRLAHRDWRYALGSFWVEWSPAGDGRVALRVRGRYDWAPHQPRITQPIHAAANGLKRDRARAFDIEGESVHLRLSDVRQASEQKPVTHRALI